MKKGFNLAEVLITLGIVGVVASLTLPNVISNYKKARTVAKLKHSYSAISQALTLAEAEYGDPANWGIEFKKGIPTENFNREEYLTNFVQKFILPYLKSAKDYGFISALSKFEYTASSWVSYYFMLSDGALVETTFSTGCIKYEGDVCVQRGYYNLLLKIDINGFNPPNQKGKDIFITEYEPNIGKYQMFRYVSDRTRSLENCKTEGISCGYIIQMDGWRMAPDYPR